MVVKLSLAVLLAAAPLEGQLVSNTLLADINSNPAVVSSYSGGFASDGVLVYFRGIDDASGESYRVWRTDGTPAGTQQLETLALNVQESLFLPGGDLFFSADELGLGVALWRSDGTRVGTVEVFAPLDWSVPPRELTLFGDAVYFLAGTESSGLEVWKSDLVTGGTALAMELLPGPASGASHLFAGAGQLFVAGPGQATLLATDGTAASATQVASFQFADGSSFAHVARVGPRVVFNIGGFGADAGWWTSDGTAAGTLRIRTTLNDFWAVEAATKVYFTAGGTASTPLLWETDGTLAGTLPVNLPTTADGQRVGFERGYALGDELVYSGFFPGLGFELGRTSGALAGGQLAADIRSGGSDSDPDDFVTFGREVFFRADDGFTGREIWKLDPVSGATQLVADLTPGPFATIVGSSPTILPSSHGVVFGQNFPQFGIEPGVTDGVQSGLLLNIGQEGNSDGSNPREFLRFGSATLFQAFDEATGGELWISDATAAGTRLVADIDPTSSGPTGAFGSFPHHFALLGERAYFFASQPATGSELWKTDGTAAGTSLVVDLIPGSGSAEPQFSSPPVVLGDELYFIAKQQSGALGLWRTDGTAHGTALVITTDPTGFVAEFVRLEVVNDRLVFNANGPEGLELWTSDGTAAGTSLLVDMTPGPSGSFISEVAVAETVAYISAQAGGNRTLWRTDGTPLGTQLILSQAAAVLSFGPSELTPVGDELVFTNDLVSTGREPWISDGTPGGTQLLLDIVPGPDSSGAHLLTPAADRVFFAVQSPVGSNHYQQLWITDRSAAGTALVAELPSPIAGHGIANLWAPGSDRRVLFSNVDSNGNEWWVSDGTLAGTRPVSDSAPGPLFANPQAGVLVGSHLVYPASDGLNGLELHALPFEATGGFAVTPLGAGCTGSSGTPTLALASGAVALNQSFSLGLEGAQPSSFAVWLYGGVYGPLPQLGVCSFQIPLPGFLQNTPIDAAGSSALSAAVPGQPGLIGAELYVQVLSVELGGPFLGLGALSDVLELVVGP